MITFAFAIASSAVGGEVFFFLFSFKLTSQYAGRSGRAFFTAAITSALKLMTGVCSGLSFDAFSPRSRTETISGPHFTSTNTFFPTGTVASISSRGGTFSPANFASFHEPTSSARNSASVQFPTSFFTPAVRSVSLSWITTTFPSFDRYTSNSAASAPCSQASLMAATVFSGASCEAPRWAMISTRGSAASAGSDKVMSIRLAAARGIGVLREGVRG